MNKRDAEITFWALIICTFLAWLFVFTVAAYSEDEIDTGTVIGYKFAFGDTKKDLVTTPVSITGLDPSTCIATASQLQAAYQAVEQASAQRVGANQWTLSSQAYCSVSTVIVPSTTVTSQPVCELVYDPASPLTALEQIEALCSP